MSGNNVEELESRIKELEASIEGLTDELVECKVRVRELEGKVEGDAGFGSEETDAEASSEESELVVPEAGESTDAADTPNTEGADEEGKTEESESDIIVA